MKIVSTGAEALQEVKLNKYDLILLDIQLPDMDGIEVAKTIRNVLKSEVPILATTAFAAVDRKELFLSAGMNDHVSKPIDLEKLYEKICQILSSEP